MPLGDTADAKGPRSRPGEAGLLVCGVCAALTLTGVTDLLSLGVAGLLAALLAGFSCVGRTVATNGAVGCVSC